jgi:hypothetical protein
MSVAVFVKFKGNTKQRLADYDKVMQELMRRGQTNRPNQLQSHVSFGVEDGMQVVDVWSSRNAFEEFQNKTLLPAIKAAGITGQPEVKIIEAYNFGYPGKHAEEEERHHPAH